MTLTLDRPALFVPDIDDDATRRGFLFGSGSLAALLAACGSDAPPASPEAGSGYPRTVRHAGGDLVIEAKPTRVVAVGPYSELDVLLALGVTPAARGDDGSPLQPWQVEAGADDVPTFSSVDGPSVEELIAFRPDLVVVNGTTYKNYPDWVDTFSSLAPVLGMPTGIEDQLSLVAEALGLDDDARDAAVAGVQSAIDAFAPARRPSSIVCANYWGDLYVWTAKSPHSALMERLGLPALTGPEAPADDPEAQGVMVSLERLDVLESDLLLIPDDPALDELEANPVFANLDVVRSGYYVRQTSPEAFAVGDVTALSLPTAIAALERALATP